MIKKKNKEINIDLSQKPGYILQKQLGGRCLIERNPGVVRAVFINIILAHNWAVGGGGAAGTGKNPEKARKEPGS